MRRCALSADEAFQKAKATARKALDIDPTLAEAHVALGTVITLYYRHWEEGNAHFKRAIDQSQLCRSPCPAWHESYNDEQIW